MPAPLAEYTAAAAMLAYSEVPIPATLAEYTATAAMLAYAGIGTSADSWKWWIFELFCLKKERSLH